MAWTAFIIGFVLGLSLVVLCRLIWLRFVKLPGLRAPFAELRSHEIY